MRNKLLVIDRAELHLSVLSKIAEQVGFTATGAHSVVEASQLLNERSFDCITLDLSLGEESGLEVLQLLSQIKCRAPVFVISASGEQTCDETVKIGNSLKLDIRSPVPNPIHLAGLRKALTGIAGATQSAPLAALSAG
jgi:two-component system, chemotaxis family, chemotaxis protein CheY